MVRWQGTESCTSASNHAHPVALHPHHEDVRITRALTPKGLLHGGQRISIRMALASAGRVRSRKKLEILEQAWVGIRLLPLSELLLELLVVLVVLLVVNVLKVGAVKWVVDLGHKGRGHRLELELVEGKVGEEVVVYDVKRAQPKRADPTRRVACEQAVDKRARDAVEEERVRHVLCEDVVVDIHRVLRLERRVPRDELKDEHAKGPPVGGTIVPLVLDDLGREVVGRAAEGVRLRLHNLGKAKVHDLDVAVGIEEQVLGL
mmetsp:Transcript_14195/g.36791  ORF Transcript_14195/g.36791 Transcript_14195/m.36791 type:complete len:261 (-) Transcript_14195:1694-2476(-)